MQCLSCRSASQKLLVGTVGKKGKNRFGKNFFAEKEPFLTVLTNGFYMQFLSRRAKIYRFHVNFEKAYSAQTFEYNSPFSADG